MDQLSSQKKCGDATHDASKSSVNIWAWWFLTCELGNKMILIILKVLHTISVCTHLTNDFKTLLAVIKTLLIYITGK